MGWGKLGEEKTRKREIRAQMICGLTIHRGAVRLPHLLTHALCHFSSTLKMLSSPLGIWLLVGGEDVGVRGQAL